MPFLRLATDHIFLNPEAHRSEPAALTPIPLDLQFDTESYAWSVALLQALKWLVRVYVVYEVRA